jgi:cytosine/adenosine deaminase-related metal-dependent hydrolase
MRLQIAAANATVGVENGRIVPPTGRFDAVFDVGDGELRPGLINAHDHLHRNHYGRLGAPPYANAYEWGDDIHVRYADTIARARAVPRRDALLHGAWKNIFSGVTTVVHHDRWESDFTARFPLRVAPIASAHSLRLDADHLCPGPFALHLAEGVDDESAEEVRTLAHHGLVTPDLLAVHVVGADDDGVALLRDGGAAIVWCPTSNVFLFGRTAPHALLAPGIDVLVGSDSLLTGAGTLLDELRFARGLGVVDDARLVDGVGAVAARRLGLPAPSLAVGAPADLVVLRRPLLDAGADDVALVVVGGVPRAVDTALVPSLGPWRPGSRPMLVDGIVKWAIDADRE